MNIEGIQPPDQAPSSGNDNKSEKGELELSFVEILPYTDENSSVSPTQLDIFIENAGSLRRKSIKNLPTIPFDKMPLEVTITLPADESKNEKEGKKINKKLDGSSLVIKDIPYGKCLIEHQVKNVELNNKYDLVSMRPVGKYPNTETDSQAEVNRFQCEIEINAKKIENKQGVLLQSIIFDCHIHIESGRCAPLPMVWNQLFLLEILKKRETILKFGKFTRFFGPLPINVEKLSIVQNMPTYLIGCRHIDRIIKEIYNVFNEFESRNFFMPSVVMPMDMEYAHILGYYGIKIYQKRTDTQEISHYWAPEYISKEDQIVVTEKNAKEDNFIHISSIVDAEIYKHHNNNQFEPLARETYIDELYIYAPLGLDNKNSHSNRYVKTHIELFDFDFDKHKDEEKDEDEDEDEEKSKQPKKKTMIFDFNDDLVEEQSKYETWEEQVAKTESVLVRSPWKILSMYHFEPRRYEFNKNWKKQLFEEDICKDNNILYLGFKIYTSLGYKPYDNRLKILSGYNNFYSECQKRNLPIMNHCTPEGMYTHDREKYISYIHPDDPEDEQRDQDDYFENEFISPDAWKAVLMDYRELKLCLAHLGGNTSIGKEWGKTMLGMISGYKFIDDNKIEESNNIYPNLYVDISSSLTSGSWKKFFKDTLCKTYQTNREAFSRIKKRILFGTDWYMILRDSVRYHQYCRKAKKLLDSIDSEFWFYATFINPMRFFGLNNERIIEIKNALNELSIYKALDENSPIKQDEIDKNAEYFIQLYNYYKYLIND